MTKKRFKFSTTLDTIYDCDSYDSETHTCESYDNLYDVADLLNFLSKENEQLKRVIAENEKLIQSTYDELTKLRCIKKNLGRIKAQWDWIMEAMQYD